MLWATLLFALAFSLAALAWVIWPLTQRAPAPPLVEDDRLADLLGRKDAVMAAIKDLEFDRKVGKLSDEDFVRYDQRLRRQAIGLIQQIEQIAPESTSLDAALEAEIARRRQVSPARPAPRPAPATVQLATQPAPQGVAVAANGHDGAPAATSSGPARFCTECGNRLEAQHRFCAQCGAPVAAR